MGNHWLVEACLYLAAVDYPALKLLLGAVGVGHVQVRHEAETLHLR